MGEIDVVGLCHRCEHRVCHIETKGRHQPRSECGDRDLAVVSCYMYAPVRPIVTGPREGDTRPRAASWPIAAREEGKRVAQDDENKVPHDVEMVVQFRENEEMIKYWRPVNETSES